ncbi:hypothetical protein B0H19DRAFT_1062888 [Mycena capillaripes]|nr:hypothetical protein B0H19DRAFT_1062888 [Mycena capillaripes]
MHDGRPYAISRIRNIRKMPYSAGLPKAQKVFPSGVRHFTNSFGCETVTYTVREYTDPRRIRTEIFEGVARAPGMATVRTDVVRLYLSSPRTVWKAGKGTMYGNGATHLDAQVEWRVASGGFCPKRSVQLVVAQQIMAVKKKCKALEKYFVQAGSAPTRCIPRTYISLKLTAGKLA